MQQQNVLTQSAGWSIVTQPQLQHGGFTLTILMLNILECFGNLLKKASVKTRLAYPMHLTCSICILLLILQAEEGDEEAWMERDRLYQTAQRGMWV
jgi:hypothetical protein